jgi:hypothetical protein
MSSVGCVAYTKESLLYNTRNGGSEEPVLEHTTYVKYLVYTT